MLVYLLWYVGECKGVCLFGFLLLCEVFFIFLDFDRGWLLYGYEDGY